MIFWIDDSQRINATQRNWIPLSNIFGRREIRRKKCTEWHQKKRFWYAKATTTCRIHIHSSHLATWINRKTMIKAKAFILWTDKIVFSGKFVCLCTSCKTKLETLNNQACRLYHKLFMVFGIGKVITSPILACCMLFAICMLLQSSLSLLFPQANTEKRRLFGSTAVLLAMFSAVKVSTTNHEKGGKKGIVSGSARHYQNRITSSCAALAVWPVDQGNRTIFTHSKQNGWCGIKRKLLWKRWED